MPAEILERPVEVEEASGQVLKTATVPPPTVPTVEPPKAQPVKSLWQKVFEGHEELLGWTPD